MADRQSGSRIAVAMSGGVDSSVAAARLVEAGHEVIGITMSLYCPERESVQARSCCGLESVHDARRVADHLGIRHYVFDFRDIFEREVIEPFCRAYLSGRTPNPCVDCNTRVRFRHLLDKVKAVGAARLATGHYARIEHDMEAERRMLARGRDPAKDQSYFLWGMTQESLARTAFPLGEMTKEETKEYARRLGLKVADKPESQEICFVPEGGYGSFVVRRCSEQIGPGPIYDLSGQVVGEHRGLPYYTIGQRSGTGVALGRPVYVVAIRPDDNAIVVGDEEALYCDQLVAGQVNWISGHAPDGEIEVTAKIRYLHTGARARVHPTGRRCAAVLFDQPQRAITPGQSVVFYRERLVLGGGVIGACHGVEGR
ncbi:hypothetical protein AMJ39_08045 [candidate division TA06 bacterium DG_24]|jgi:tRNA-specific 2-thiouridylase|uniref:tRNA-specific 2-thiouridylase MnmA n=2 Tax=Bacteria division TA06 TaxID=1156500 RepID=A0A0S8G507_UNCT6|nr:MAG: hypothetical protein AMJ39_08045 [candidate division TA06 bacterium DG_24]KPK67004.1 MAG: hypothetical protein AMJ82_11470 [candidate division TA06 bacterium SM23_40]